MFRSAWNRHAPLITRRAWKKCTPWMNSHVLQLIHKRDSSYKCFLRNRTDELYCACKILRNTLTNAARIAKRDFFIHGARASTRQFWRHIKQNTGIGRVKQNLTPWPSHNATAAKLSANRINDNFVDSVLVLTKSVKLTTSDTINDTNNNSSPREPFAFKSVSTHNQLTTKSDDIWS